MLCTNSIIELTHGNPLGAGALLDFLRMDYSSYTAVAKSAGGTPALMGAVRFNIGEESARLAFLAPATALEDDCLVALLEHLTCESGNRGAFRLLAEIDEDDPTFEHFRSAGFCVYTRQQIWRLAARAPENGNGAHQWQPLYSLNPLALQSLYHAVVPPLVQSAEGMDKRPWQGLGYLQDNELLAMVEVINGAHGIYLLPVVHPNLRQPTELLQTLLMQFPSAWGRPLYLAVRDYQSWLNAAIENLEGQPGSRKVLLVKHLMRRQRVPVTSAIRKVLELHNIEPTVPLSQAKRGKDEQ